MASPVLQFKRGLSSNVGIASFKAGEPGFTTDKYDFYIGLDGTQANQKFFGSARYWTRETGSAAALLKLVDKNGSNSINLKSPDTLSGIATYTFPATPTAGNYLTVAADGTMSWASVTSSQSFSNATLTGITTIGNSGADTLNIAANTNVTGVATFTQNITGTISTATRATKIDTNSTADTGTFYPIFTNTNTAGTGLNAYVDPTAGGISFDASANSLTLGGNIAVNGGSITSSAGVATIFSTSTSVLAYGGATSLIIGNTSGIATINNPTVVGTQATQNLYNTVATNLNFGGAATALVMGATTGIATINNPTVVGTATTQNLYNTVATSLNFGGAATALVMGATSGIATINNPTLVGTATTQNLYNTVATTVNAFGQASTIGIGSATGTATINNPTLTLPNATTVNVNGANPTLASSSTGTLTLFNTNIASVNAFGTATSIVLGAATGITTVNNSLRITKSLYDSTNSAGTSGQFLVVTGTGIGWTTISGVSAGTISTATRAQTLDATSTADTGTFYPLFANTNTAGTGLTAYLDPTAGGISFDASANTLTLGGNLNVNGGTVASTSATANVFNATATAVNAFGAASSLVMGATTGIATINNPTVVGTATTQNLYNTVATTVNAFGFASTLGIGSATGTVTIANPTLTLSNGTNFNINGANPTLASSSTGTLTLFNTNIASVNAFGTATNIVLGNTTGVTTVRNSLRVTNALYDSNNNAGTSGYLLTSTGTGIGWTTVLPTSLTGTISTATRATTVDTTLTTTSQNYYIPFVTNNGTTTGETIRVGAALSVNPSTNTLTVANAQHSAIKAVDGTAAITITSGTGAVQTASDLTVNGNFFVNGNTTQVNTSELQVYDRTITLGIQSGTAPTSTTWDLGILMDYGNAGVAQTAGVIWKTNGLATPRFQFAANSNNPAGINTNTPVETVATFAPIEVSELWINNTCTGGASQVIACSGSNLVLQNIVVDAGTF